jgi:hypothetical protein
MIGCINMNICKICGSTGEHTQCTGCERFVCEQCESLLTDALTGGYCAECLDKPAIADLRQYLRSGEHKAVSRDGREVRWFGVRRCVADDGAIMGWLVSGGGQVTPCESPLAVEAAIRGMF